MSVLGWFHVEHETPKTPTDKCKRALRRTSLCTVDCSVGTGLNRRRSDQIPRSSQLSYQRSMIIEDVPSLSVKKNYGTGLRDSRSARAGVDVTPALA